MSVFTDKLDLKKYYSCDGLELGYSGYDFEEVEEQRDELLEALIESIKPYTNAMICPTFENSSMGKKIIPVIEKITRMTWEDVKIIISEN